MTAQAKKYLVVGPAWVGDMVMAQTLFKVLKQQDSDCTIDVIAPDWSRPLLDRMVEVNQAISLPIGHGRLALIKRYHIAKNLRQHQYDHAILMPNSFKSALIPFLAKIPLRTGWLGEWRYGLLNDIRYLDKKALPLMVQRFIALGLPEQASLPEALIKPSLQVQPKKVQQAVEKYRLSADTKPILALCPGAEFGPAKRWPENYYAEVANEKMAEGYQVWLFGSPKDRPIATEIQRLTKQRCVDLTGKTNLAEAIDLLSLADRVVSNDSGLMHIASALDRRVVVIYGSSSPRFTPPLANRVKIVSLGLDCSPCFKRLCPLQHLHCLKHLTSDHVLKAMQELA